jgi:hypothetical protein
MLEKGNTALNIKLEVGSRGGPGEAKRTQTRNLYMPVCGYTILGECSWVLCAADQAVCVVSDGRHMPTRVRCSHSCLAVLACVSPGLPA